VAGKAALNTFILKAGQTCQASRLARTTNIAFGAAFQANTAVASQAIGALFTLAAELFAMAARARIRAIVPIVVVGVDTALLFEITDGIGRTARKLVETALLGQQDFRRLPFRNPLFGAATA